MRPSPAPNRGRHYTPRRRLVEGLLRRVYRGDWPARLWGLWPSSRRVRCVRHTLAVLPLGQPPVRIGFASDLHLGPTTSPHTLDAAFAILADAEVDVLLLGGDFVFLDVTSAKADELVRRARGVGAKTTAAVLGNHDLWDDYRLLEHALEAAGIPVLTNRSLRLPAPHDTVVVVGIDDPWTGDPDVDGAFAADREPGTRIVLCHAPEGLPLVRGTQAVLMLCGHTHGGQIAAPWGPMVVPGPVSRQHPAGIYGIDGLTLFVSRGIGGVEVPVRTFAPPDVAVITLISVDATE